MRTICKRQGLGVKGVLNLDGLPTCPRDQSSVLASLPPFPYCYCYRLSRLDVTLPHVVVNAF